VGSHENNANKSSFEEINVKTDEYSLIFHGNLCDINTMHQSLDTKKDQPKPKQMVQQPQTKKDQPKPVVITPNVQKLHTKKKISLPPLHTKLSPSGPNLVTPPLVGSLPFNELYPVIAISKKKTCPGKEKKKPQKFACRCVKSRCLKLYCVCFQNGTLCGPSCTCVSCLNNKSELSGKLMKAKQEYLKRKPDAFMKKLKETKKTDCACRTNR
jgi:hypothetical protein